MYRIAIAAAVLILAGCETEYRDITVYKPKPEGIALSSAEDLAKIGVDDEYPLDGVYYLDKDIDLPDGVWTPIGTAVQPFQGVFDGRGKRITGLVLGSGIYTGLFGYVSYARIEQLSLSLESANITTEGAAFIGALAGRADHTLLRSIEVSGNAGIRVTANGTANIGGVIGYLGQDSKADRIYADLSIRGENGTLSIGGVAGRVEAGNLVFCRVEADRLEGTTSAGTLAVGGVAGSGTMTLQDCEAGIAEGVFGKNTGTAGDVYVGGLAGKADEWTPPRYSVTQSRFSGAVSVKAETQDPNHTGGVYAGGVAGYGRILRGFVQDAAKISVTAAGRGSVYVGGLVGWGTVHESAFPQAGSVTVTRNAGQTGLPNTQTCVGGLVGLGNCLNGFSCTEVTLTTNFRETTAGSAESPYCATAGGVVGSSVPGAGGQIENAYSAGNVTVTNINANEYVAAGGVTGLIYRNSGTAMSANVSLNTVTVTSPDAGKVSAHRSAGKITDNPSGNELDSNTVVTGASVTVNGTVSAPDNNPNGLDGSLWNDKGAEFEGSVFEWIQWDYETIWKWDADLGRPVLQFFYPEEPEEEGGK